jgi:dienelactone hydrolase
VNDFEDLQKRVFALYANGRFAEIPELLDGAVDRFPNWRSRITYWQACIDSLLGEPERALERLRRGAVEGMFWPENSLNTDPDLDAARVLAGYDQMVEAVRRSAERGNVNRPEKPEVLLFAPKAGPVRGLLIGLHMYARSAAESVQYWRPATEEGLVVAVPESTQVGGDGEPAWADPAITARDVRLAREEALNRHPDAATATVLGGASQGGGRAAAIALTGNPFPCRGLVAVVSAYPDVPDVASAARDAGARGLRAYLLTGDRDTTRDQVTHLYDDLVAGGVPARQDVVPDLGHEFPDDFPMRLRHAIGFIFDA